MEEIDDKITQLSEGVNEINNQLSVVNNKLDEVNSKLDMQQESLTEISDSISILAGNVEANQMSTTSQISDLSERVETLVQNQTSELKVALFNSTVEIKSATTLLNNLDKYYSSFDGLLSVEETILQDLSNFQKNITTFVEAVGELKNSEEVSAVINKCTLNYAGSYDELSEEEKELLNTEVTLNETETVKVGEYLEDYLELLHTYMTETIFQKSSGYTSNIYDTVKLMGEYITGDVQSVGNVGVGEIFYKMSMLDKSTNVEVHEAYKSFMSTILQDYAVTAYLCELSLSYQIAYETANDGNTVLIKGYKERLNSVCTQMEKVQSYVAYELENCIRKYDFADYRDGEYDKSICYYGNILNASNGINGWMCVKKEDLYISPMLSSESLEIAVAEEKQLHFYQGLEEHTEGVTWSSNDETIAVVNEDGTVSGVTPGIALITATFGEYEVYCAVSVGNCFAKENGTGVSHFYYGEEYYSINVSQGYDYYYNVQCYSGNAVTLDDTNKSVSLIEATNLSEKDIDLYTWGSTAGYVAEYIDGHIIMTDNGSCVIYGYRYLEDEDTYECIGIPVTVTEDTSAEMESDVETNLKDYSDYTKISTKEDLIALSQNPDGWGPEDKYVLTADIDLGGMEWEPIGYQFAMGSNSTSFGTSLLEEWGYVTISQPFRGVFEGNGYKIKNFKITEIHHQDAIKAALEASYEAYNQESYFQVRNEIGAMSIGLFGCVDGATINNLTISGGSIKLEEGITGDTVTIGGEDYTLEMAADATVYAGILAGNATHNIGYYWNQEKDIFAKNKVDDQTFITIAEDADISEYTKDMPAEIYALGRNSGGFTQYIAAKILEKDISRDNPFINCNVEGEIDIAVGQICAGTLFGLANTDILNCSAKGTINTNATYTGLGEKGTVGGLIGCWTSSSSRQIYNCTTDVQISSLGDVSAGGLLGRTETASLNDFSEFIIGADEVKDADDAVLEMMENRNTLFVTSVELIAEYNGYVGASDMTIGGQAENNTIENCQVLGDIDSEGNAGGVIGDKIINSHNTKSTTKAVEGVYQYITTFSQTNVDIFECFVNADITTAGKYAGGVLGNSERVIFEDDIEEDSETEVLEAIYGGEIKNCYVHGDITAVEGAAGVVGGRHGSEYHTRTYDGLSITGVIAACNEITANNSEGDSQVYPIANPDISDTTISNTGYYNNTTYTYTVSGTPMYGATSKSNQGEALSTTQLNSSDNYIQIWGRSFCDLTYLDYSNNVVPAVLAERYFFNIEKAKKYYRVGDTFEPITEMILYNGLGSDIVTDGVSSTTPDMSTPGIRKVTVSYGDFEDSYNVYIYPVEEAYIKVMEKPGLVQEDDAYMLSGGKIGVYLSDGSLSKTVDINECEKTYEEDYAKIEYNNLTTSIKILELKVYSNALVRNASVEQISCEYYLENDNVDCSEVVRTSRQVTYEGKTNTTNLLGSTLNEDMTITSDTYVLTLYEDIESVVSFDGNGGTGVMEDMDTINGEYVLPENGFTAPEGYKFKAWAVGSVDGTQYAEGSSIQVESDTTLYAVWEKKEEPTTEEPTTEAPTTEEPTTEEPTTEEPTTEEPTTEVPTTEEPTTEEPTTKAPTTEEPTTKEPTTEEPTTKPQTTDNNQKKVYGNWEVYTSGKIVNTKTKEVYLLNTKTNQVSYEKCGTGTKVSIPEKIKVNGKTYKVTSIAAKAFKNNKKLKSVVIPKTVKKIGKQAFYGCSKLKKITIKTKMLKMNRVGSKAFAKIYKKPTIKVPKKKYKSYKKILKKRGVGKKAKWKKLK